MALSHLRFPNFCVLAKRSRFFLPFRSIQRNLLILFIGGRRTRRRKVEKAMAISSLSASTVPPLKTPPSQLSANLTSLSSLQFPVQLHRLQFGNRGISFLSRSRILPLVILLHSIPQFLSCFVFLFIFG